MGTIKDLEDYVSSVIEKASVENSTFGVKQMLSALKKVRSKLATFKNVAAIWVDTEDELPEDGKQVIVDVHGEIHEGWHVGSGKWTVRDGGDYVTVGSASRWLKELDIK